MQKRCAGIAPNLLRTVFGPDRTLYARSGTRSDEVEWENDVSVTGLRRALDGALNLHKGYPKNRELLLGKQPSKPTFPTHEKYPFGDQITTLQVKTCWLSNRRRRSTFTARSSRVGFTFWRAKDFFKSDSQFLSPTVAINAKNRSVPID